MGARTAFDAALSAARQWHSALPALSEFCDWPDDLIYAARAPVTIPAIRLLQNDPGQPSLTSRPLRDALIALAPYVEWRHTYTEAEVGRDFLNRYGWFELAGPTGHYLSHLVRMTVGYWGPDLNYGRHQHQPEELYSVVSGSAEFFADGMPSRTLGPDGTALHLSNQPHAMRTMDQPILTFVLWRGDGLNDTPRMTTA